MKKYIGFLVVLSVLVLGVPIVNAAAITPVTGTASRVCLPTTAPFITVISPNGGEIFTAGQQITVTWTSCNIPANSPIRIDLTEYSSAEPENFSLSLTQTANDGTEAVTLPTSSSWSQMFFGNKFKISVWQTNYSGLTAPIDFSDKLFTINAPAKSAVIATVAPKIVTPITNATSSKVSLNPSSSLAIKTTNNPFQIYSALGHLVNYEVWSQIFDRTNDISSDNRILQAQLTCPTGKVLLGGGYALPGSGMTHNTFMFVNTINSGIYEVGVWDPDQSISNLVLTVTCASVQ